MRIELNSYAPDGRVKISGSSKDISKQSSQSEATLILNNLESVKLK